MNQRENLNNLVLKEVNHYLNLKILETKVRVPYAINDVEIAFINLMKKANVSDKKIREVHNMYKRRKTLYGWGRGKNSPEQLEQYTQELIQKLGFDTTNPTECGIRSFMTQFNLGVDCSGFLFHILNIELADFNIAKVLKLENEACPENKAGTKRFYENSKTIKLKDIQPLDLIFIKDVDDLVYHVAIIPKKNQQLYVAQSSGFTKPQGVTLTKFYIENNLPKFTFHQTLGKSWTTLYKEKRLVFARLNS